MAQSQEILKKLKQNLKEGAFVLGLGILCNVLGRIFNIEAFKFSNETMRDAGKFLIFLLAGYLLLKCTEAVVAAIHESRDN
jgi:hypothetical protein